MGTFPSDIKKFKCDRCPGLPCELTSPGDMIPHECPFDVRVTDWKEVEG
jgi:hypothetical protein